MHSSLAGSAPAPIVLTGADRRPATSLDGDWGAIVDPYFSGLFSFHHQEKSDGWF
jgi:beta-glucuronidase